MKTPRTYRIITLLIAALVFSPILNYSIAQAMMVEDHGQMQMELTTPEKCHKTADDHQCKHCADTADSQCCQHPSNGQCDNSCEHGVSSVAMTTQALDTNHDQQDKHTTIKQLMHSIDPDAMLRPPQLA